MIISLISPNKWISKSAKRGADNSWEVIILVFFLSKSSVNGYLRYIPEGTEVHVPAYTLHRDPRYFSHSDDFRPERWLGEPGFVHCPEAFIPFSFGPQNCVGQRLARQEMLMVVSVLLQRFDFRLNDGFDAEAWPLLLRDYFVLTKGPLPVILTPRDVQK